MAERLGDAVLALSTDDSRYNEGMARAETRARDLQGRFTKTGEESGSLGNKLGSLGGRVGQLGTKFKNMAKGAADATKVLVAIGAAAVTLGMNFDAELAKIEGLVGISSDQIAEMREEVLALGPAVGKGPQELAEALFFVTSAGFEGAEALGVLENAAKASVAGLGDTATVADAVTSAINAYGAGALSAADATGIMVAAVREGKLDADSLAGSLGQVLPVAAELGVDFHQVGAAVAALSRGGLDASQSVTGLRGILAALLRPSKQSADTLAEFGLSADGLKRQLREEGLLAVLETLKATFGDNQEAIARVFPDIEGLAAALSLTGANAEETRAIFQSLAAAGEDDLAAAFDVAADTAQNKTARAMSALNTSMIALSDSLMPIVLPALEFVAEQLARLPEIIRQVTFLIENFSTAFTVLADMIVEDVGAMVESVIALVTDMVDQIWQELGGELAAIADSVGATVDEITGFFEDMWTDVVGQSFVPDMIDAIAAEFARLPSVMSDPAERATSEVERSFENVQSAVSDALGRMADDLLQGEVSWRSFAAVAIDALQQILEAEIAASGGTGGIDLGTIFSFVGDIFTPTPTAPPRGRALGGHVSAFETVMVGERGIEFFQPDTGGTIISNKDLAGMAGGPVINNNIDARGAERGVEIRIRQAMDEAVQRTLAVIESSATHGGRFARLARV